MAPTRLVKLAQTAGLIFALSQSVCFAQLEQDQIVSFTQLQAEQGKSVYEENCAACHGVNMAGVGVTPSLSGDNFASKCSGASLADLFTQLRRMPPENPAGLAEQSYQQILAYILQTNGVTSGTEPLVSKLDADESRTVPVMPESQSSATVIVQLDQHSRNLLNNLSAVSAEMLLNPSPNDWLLWHRTYDNQGFSPLQQINRDNVADLQLSWTFPLAIGENNPGPLIHDGVMFLFTYPDTVLAIDATNGALLWQYQHQSQTRSSQKKGVALHGNKVIVPTSDLHLLALNAKSGELIWDHEIAIEDGLSGYHLRSAPFIVGDIIMQGITAIRVPKGGFIVAVDVETGQESWRFNTIPGPGEPGGNSWNDLPLQERNGGSVWNQGSYDAELNLAFFGAAPTYDTGALLYPVEKDGITNDALYTNSTLALNPQTGELVWYYQHLANDQWDLDWAFERQIVELSSESMAGKGSGKATDKPTRKIVLTMGKPAILEAMDAATGEYLFSMDMGLQNVVLAIDPVTG